MSPPPQLPPKLHSVGCTSGPQEMFRNAGVKLCGRPSHASHLQSLGCVTVEKRILPYFSICFDLRQLDLLYLRITINLAKLFLKTGYIFSF